MSDETMRHTVVRLRRERDEARAEVLDLVAEVGREHAEVERLREELDNCKGGGAYRDEVGSLTSENERLRAAVQAVRDLAVRAVPGLSGPPKDCTNNCWTGDCDCSGNWVALAWSLDPAKVLAALGGEQGA